MCGIFYLVTHMKSALGGRWWVTRGVECGDTSIRWATRKIDIVFKISSSWYRPNAEPSPSMLRDATLICGGDGDIPPPPPSMRNMSSWSRASATLGICGPVSTVNTMMLSNTSFRYVHVSTSSRFLEVNVTSSSRGGDKSSINQKSCITATALQMNLFK